MSERRRRGRAPKPKPPLADAHDPESLGSWSAKHLSWMLVHAYSEQTVELREMWLRAFIAWCSERSITKPAEITRPILERYQRHLFQHRKSNGKPLSWRSQVTRLVPVRTYFRWLTRQGVIGSNPAADLDMPKTQRALPKHVLTAAEADQVINQADVNEPTGLRDRAMMEVLYSTGIRRMELAALRLFDLEPERGTLRIRRGKGGKERVVPIGERAMKWLSKYQDEARPRLVTGTDEGIMFVNADGGTFDLQYLSNLVRGYVTKADIGKTGACHLFRHTCATLMLDNGADLRHVQLLLGHALIETTTIYTFVSIARLLEVHRRCHPASAQHPVKTAGTTAEKPEPAVVNADVEDELLDVLGDDDDEDEA